MHCPGMTLENVEHLDFDDRQLMSHGRIVMEALGAAVECLHDSDQLSILLIGQRLYTYCNLPNVIMVTTCSNV